MSKLRLYLDESGHSATHPVIAVAGYLAPESQWENFEEEWRSVLLAHGVVRPDGSPAVFHMTDFEARKRLFKEWDKGRRERLLGALFAVLEEHRLYATGFVVSVEWWRSIDWAAVTPEHVPLQDPYHHAVQAAVTAAIRLAAEPDAIELNGSDGMTCVFAQPREFGGQAARYLTSLASYVSTSRFPVQVEFAPDAAGAPLQAADIVAFELRWRFTRPDLRRWPMEQILRSRRAAFGAVPPEAFTAATASLNGDATIISHSDRVLRVRPEVRKASKRGSSTG